MIGGELVQFGPVDVAWYEDNKSVGGVWRASQEQCKINVNGRGSFGSRIEVGLPLVPQFSECWSGCSWVAFILFSWGHSYCLTSHRAWMWLAGSQVLSLSR